MKGMRLLALAAVLVWGAFAQGYFATRSVHGIVTDSAGEPLKGAVVQLEDTRTLQIRTFITKRDGAYTFHRLSTEVDYTLQAAFQGRQSGTKRLSRLDSHKDKKIDLKVGG